MPERRAQLFETLKGLFLFKALDEDQVQRLVNVVETVDLAEGEHLFSERDRDDHFYVVLSGRVGVEAWQGEARSGILLRKPGEFFGAEQLLFGKWRPLSVQALTAARLVRIQPETLANFLLEIPQLKASLKSALETERTIQGSHFRWLGEEEATYLVARKHPAYLLVAMLPPVAAGWVSVFLFIFAALAAPGSLRLVLEWGAYLTLAVAILWAAWNYYDWSNDYYLVTDQRVVWLEKVYALYDSRQEAPLSAIQSVGVRTSLIGRILGYGDVTIRTYTGLIMFRDVGEPKKIKELIEDDRYRARQRVQRIDAAAMDRVIRYKIGLEEPPEKGGPSQPRQPAAQRPESLWTRLAKYFSTRVVEGDVITYRKHAFILLTKTWMPAVLEVGLLALTLRALDNALENENAFPTPNTTILVFMFFSGVLFLWWLYQYVDWRNDIYQITTDRVIDSERKPLGTEKTKSALLANILSLEHERIGLIGLVLNFGNVKINVGDIKLTFVGIHNPTRAQQDISSRMYAVRQKADEDEAARQREQVATWLAAYHRQVATGENPENPPQNSQNTG